mgnify:CR=1 FL=1
MDRYKLNRILTITALVVFGVLVLNEVYNLALKFVLVGSGDFKIVLKRGDSIVNYQNINDIKPNHIPLEATNIRLILFKGRKRYITDIKLAEDKEEYLWEVNKLRSGQYTLKAIAYVDTSEGKSSQGFIIALGSKEIEINKDKVNQEDLVIDKIRYSFEKPTSPIVEGEFYRITLRPELKGFNVKLSKAITTLSPLKEDIILTNLNYRKFVQAHVYNLSSGYFSISSDLAYNSYIYSDKRYFQFSTLLGDFYYTDEGVRNLRIFFPCFFCGDTEEYIEIEPAMKEPVDRRMRIDTRKVPGD